MAYPDTVSERRLARDGHWYTAAEFREYYGHSWERFWNEYGSIASSSTLPERRVARDGYLYTTEEFKQYYGLFWEQNWNECHAMPPADDSEHAADGGHDPHLAADGGNDSHLAAKPILLHPSMLAHVRRHGARQGAPRSLHKLARDALNKISQKTVYSDENLNNWFHWIPYVAAHASCDEIVGPGIIHAMARFLSLQIAPRDPNRGGAPRCDFCFIRRDGSVCRLHPGKTRKEDARLIIYHVGDPRLIFFMFEAHMCGC